MDIYYYSIDSKVLMLNFSQVSGVEITQDIFYMYKMYRASPADDFLSTSLSWLISTEHSHLGTDISAAVSWSIHN